MKGRFVELAWYCPDHNGLFSDGRARYQILRLFCPQRNSRNGNDGDTLQLGLEDQTEIKISFKDIVTPRISRGHLTPGPPASFRMPLHIKAKMLKEDLKIERRGDTTYFTVELLSDPPK